MADRTYGRGAGERPFRPVPVVKPRRRPVSMLYDEFHTAYPQTGVYAIAENHSESNPEHNSESRQ